MDFGISVYLDEEATKRANKLAAEREAAAQVQRLAVERLASALAKLAEKDLTCQIAEDLPEAFRQLQHDFNSVVAQLAAAFRNVSHAAEGVLSSSKEIFFRERRHFEHLRQQVLPPLIASARAGGKLRIWSAGCSTGQEPYSIALSLLSLEPQAHRLDVKILATDIDPRVIEAGRGGVYPEAALTEVPPDLRQRYFARGAGAERQSWGVADEMRALVSFRVLNLNADWPMQGQFAVIFCQNVVIYFDEQVQRSLWSKFATKLAPGGWLYIGHSERVSGPASVHLRGAGTTTYQLDSSRQT
jgi:chemotaxis protein methyltransferase CheR